MPLYESTFIARHDMSAQQVESLAQNFTEIIKGNGGDVGKTEFWGLKTLAYRIKKNRKGHYVFFNIDAPAAAVAELERNMRLNEDVLRYLTVRVDELDPEPSPMMQARASRDERSRRGSGPGRPRGESAERGAVAPEAEEPAKDGPSKPAAAEAEADEKVKNEPAKTTAKADAVAERAIESDNESGGEE